MVDARASRDAGRRSIVGPCAAAVEGRKRTAPLDATAPTSVVATALPSNQFCFRPKSLQKLYKRHLVVRLQIPQDGDLKISDACLGGETTHDNLIKSLSNFATGKLPKSAAEILSSRLVALRKSNGDVCPVAISEALRRVAARAICLHSRNAFASYFSPIQHGVSTPGGSELILHHVQALLNRNADWMLLKTDVKNAFNSISREAIRRRLSESFPSLMPHFRQM